MHYPQHGVRLHADQAHGEDGGHVGLPWALVPQLFDCFLKTFPCEKCAPPPQLPMSYPAQPAYDQPPGHQGQGHHRQDPVKQSLQTNTPCTCLFSPGPVRNVNVDNGGSDHLAPVVCEASQEVLLVITETVMHKEDCAPLSTRAKSIRVSCLLVLLTGRCQDVRGAVHVPHKLVL